MVYKLKGGMMKKSYMRKKRDVIKKDERSEDFDFLYAGLLIVTFLVLILMEVLSCKASIHLYDITGSILEAIMIFILGIIADLVFLTLLLILSGSDDLIDYTMCPLICLLIIELILVLIGLI